jgi:hypothetical protein
MEIKIGNREKGSDSKKGQAALDFMMTYGWAILLVVIIAVALFAMGIFEPANFVGSKAAGFGGVVVQSNSWSIDSAGTFSMKVTNTVGNPVRLDSINVTIASASVLVPVSNVTIANGQDSAIFTSATGAFGPQSVGAGYSAKVNIKYTDLVSSFPQTSSGTLTGKVS